MTSRNRDDSRETAGAHDRGSLVEAIERLEDRTPGRMGVQYQVARAVRSYVEERVPGWLVLIWSNEREIEARIRRGELELCAAIREAGWWLQ